MQSLNDAARLARENILKCMGEGRLDEAEKWANIYGAIVGKEPFARQPARTVVTVTPVEDHGSV